MGPIRLPGRRFVRWLLALVLSGGLLGPSQAQTLEERWQNLSPDAIHFLYTDYLQTVMDALLMVHQACSKPTPRCGFVESQAIEKQLIQKHPVAMVLFGDIVRSLYAAIPMGFSGKTLSKMKDPVALQKLTEALVQTSKQVPLPTKITAQEVLNALGLADCPQTQTALNPDIVVVAIDEISFQEIGPFPWKRTVYADLLTTLNQYGVKLIVFDIMFGMPSSFPEADRRLADTLKKYKNTVIASKIETGGFESDRAISATTYYTEPIFAEHTTVGFSNMPEDIDNRIRKMPLTQTLADMVPPVQPHMMLQALRKLNPAKATVLEKKYTTQPLCVDFHGGAAYPQVSFYATRLKESEFKALTGKTPAQMFANKIVLVGATAEVLHDHHKTPMGEISGVAILAHFLDTLLRQP